MVEVADIHGGVGGCGGGRGGGGGGSWQGAGRVMGAGGARGPAQLSSRVKGDQQCDRERLLTLLLPPLLLLLLCGLQQRMGQRVTRPGHQQELRGPGRGQ